MIDMTVHVGTSGFSYKHWEDGVFYPKGLPKSRQFEFYCEHFDTVEMNVTFYRMPSIETFQGWNRRSPEDFRFVLKGSRYITHIKRLKDAKEPVALFFDRARPILKKTDCILWQLPPRFRANLERLESFLKIIGRRKSVLHAFEFRDASWFVSDAFDMIHDRGMSIVRADWPGLGPDMPKDQPFEYIRRHGTHGGRNYEGLYSDSNLKEDARLIRRWKKAGKEVFVYFNNDARGYAVRNAMDLRKMLGLVISY